ncbi:MAG: N,N-dimethylformamidase beta subunit family domain-containing protein [Planctomycetaceae bacterium]
MTAPDSSDANFGNRIPRRDLLKSAAAAGMFGGLLGGRPSAARANVAPGTSLIWDENQKPGHGDWQLTYVRTAGARRSKLLEGYCSQRSVRPGESLDIMLSAEADTEAVIDVYRMGYYGGAGARKITRLGPFPVTPQPDPAVGEHRVRECQWKPTSTLTIPDDWVSGVYLGKLMCNSHRYQSYIIFIVRDDRKADLLFQCSDNTWGAYNKWPDEYSLYDSDPPSHSLNGTTRISFDRPYSKYPQVVDQALSVGSGEFLCWEFPLAYWLEQHGYDVTYLSNVDLHTEPQGLSRGKMFLSVGHDEYWSLEMYNHLMQAVQDGLNVAFLSGNSVCFVAPLVPSSDGRPSRIFHRAGRYGGLLEAESFMGPFDMEGPNENLLIGARTINPFNGSGDWIVSKADHWLFEGTGMKNGDGIPGLVGWEFHGDPAKIPGLEVVAEGTSINGGDAKAHWTATIYPGPKGNLVFNASTIYWSMGLSRPPGFAPPFAHYGRPHGPDQRVQTITANFLKKCGVNAVG